MAGLIMDAQGEHPEKKLISRNVANNKARVENPHPAISIFNFHYAAPPDTVAMNYDLNKVIGDNETGFRGTNDAPYRTEAWDFIIAGGALYNNLDYSFVAGQEDGTFVYPEKQPGGGNPGFRKQMRLLKEFINGFDFINMRPENSIIEGGVPGSMTARALVQPGKAYAVYFRSTSPSGDRAALQLRLPAGSYRAEWIDPQTGARRRFEQFKHGGGARGLDVPAFTEDLALRILAVPALPAE
jgi:hypothetical protein